MSIIVLLLNNSILLQIYNPLDYITYLCKYKGGVYLNNKIFFFKKEPLG